MNNSVVQKIEKKLNKELLTKNKWDDITDGSYTSLRSTGSQPAQLY